MSVTIQDAPALNRMEAGKYLETVPVLIPAVAEVVFDRDVRVVEIHLVNESANPVTVTILDRQSTPRSIVPTVTIDGNSDHIREFTGRFCPGGVTWAASDGNSVAGYMRVRK